MFTKLQENTCPTTKGGGINYQTVTIAIMVSRESAEVTDHPSEKFGHSIYIDALSKQLGVISK